jgi:hypothetical protein
VLQTCGAMAVPPLTEMLVLPLLVVSVPPNSTGELMWLAYAAAVPAPTTTTATAKLPSRRDFLLSPVGKKMLPSRKGRAGSAARSGV